MTFRATRCSLPVDAAEILAQLSDLPAPLGAVGIFLQKVARGRPAPPAPHSRPRDAGFIDPRTSLAPVLDALDALNGQIRVEYCEPPTFAGLKRRIAKAREEVE